MPQFDLSTLPSQLLWLAISFGILYWIIKSKFMPKMGITFSDRKIRFEADLVAAEKAKNKAEAVERRIERTLDKAKKNSMEAYKKAEEEIKQSTEKKRAEIAKKLTKKLQDSDKKIAKFYEQSAEDVKKITKDIVLQTSADLADFKVSDKILASKI